MQTLYITYDGLTDPLGQSQVLPYLSGLAAKGHKITVISCEKKEMMIYREAVGASMMRHGISWIPLEYPVSSSAAARLWVIFRMRAVALRFARTHSVSLVHCRSYISALIGLELKRMLKLKFVFDMRGLWVDERLEGGIWKRTNPFQYLALRYFNKKEKAFLREADSIISLTKKAVDEIIRKAGPGAKLPPIEVIPCCVDALLFDGDRVKTENPGPAAMELPLPPESFVLGYAGSLGTWYMLDEMLDFYRTLLAGKPDAYFLFLTPTDKRFVVEAARRRRVPDGRIIVRYCRREEMPAMMSRFNLSVFFIRPSYSKIASCPTRMAELMAMGIPFVCNTGIGDVEEITSHLQAAEAVSSFEPAAYRAALGRIDGTDDAARLELRAKAMELFSLEHGVMLYNKVYQSLSEGRPG